MKIIKKTYIYLILLSFLTTGCISTNTNRLSSSLDSPKVTAVPLDAEISVSSDRKIYGKSSSTILFGFIRLNGDNKYVENVSYSSSALSKFNPFKSLSAQEKTKAAAVYNAVSKYDADVIVAPRYEVATEDYFFVKKVDVKVTGYKGTITGFKKSRDRDAKFSVNAQVGN